MILPHDDDIVGSHAKRIFKIYFSNVSSFVLVVSKEKLMKPDDNSDLIIKHHLHKAATDIQRGNIIVAFLMTVDKHNCVQTMYIGNDEYVASKDQLLDAVERVFSYVHTGHADISTLENEATIN
jgi:hypothetical protein